MSMDILLRLLKFTQYSFSSYLLTPTRWLVIKVFIVCPLYLSIYALSYTSISGWRLLCSVYSHHRRCRVVKLATNRYDMTIYGHWGEGYTTYSRDQTIGDWWGARLAQINPGSLCHLSVRYTWEWEYIYMVLEAGQCCLRQLLHMHRSAGTETAIEVYGLIGWTKRTCDENVQTWHVLVRT